MPLQPPGKIGKAEFVALTAMMFATVAFSVDAMLPAFPQMAEDLSAQGNVHLVLTVFMSGLAFGTLFAGPLSDAFGRRPIMFAGLALYLLGSVGAWIVDDFTIILIARALQGVGAAGPRIISMAITRDLYTGRQMAQIVSFAMMLFAIVPMIAPVMGAVLQDSFGWRSIFLAFLIFGLVLGLWFGLRLPETLSASDQRRFSFGNMVSAIAEVLRHRAVRLAILAQAAAMSLIFGLLVMVQPIYDVSFGRADTFPYWFGGIALISAVSTSAANAWLVVRLGMRRLITFGLGAQIVSASIAWMVIAAAPGFSFGVFIVWQFLLIWLTGLCVGNLNALALEPMGHIAGMTASITGAVSTVIASVTAAIVGTLFDGTPIPLLASTLLMSSFGYVIMLRLRSATLQDRSA